MCRRDFTDEEAEQIFKALNERFSAEWDVDISWGRAIFDTERLLRTHHLQGATTRHHRKQVRL